MSIKIGIRPINDGRDSVRSKIEEKTFWMANAAKKLIEENVYSLDGKPVECVIPSHTICNAAEALDVDQMFDKEGIMISLSVTPIFCFGTETIDMNKTRIKAIWGNNGTERPGAVYLACANAAYAERGLPVFSIYGRDVQNAEADIIPEDVKEKILLFAKAAVAVAQMKDHSYVSIGGVSMGIAGSYMDPLVLQEYFGIRAEWVDMSEINKRMAKGIYDTEEFELAYKWVKENLNEGKDYYNPEDKHKTRKEKDKIWETQVKMYLIIRDILFGNPKLAEKGFYEESLGKKAIAGGFQGQRMWTDYMPDNDFGETFLSSSFDHNGKKAPVPFATENDHLNALSMMMGTLLTNRATIFADVRTFWSPESVKEATNQKLTGIASNGFIHLNNSGAAALDGAAEMKENGERVMKEWFKVTDEDIKATLDNTSFHPANLEYFKGSGFSTHYVTRAEMPVTMIRLNRVYGVGPVLQVVEGWTVNLDKKISDPIEKRPDRCWPSTFFVPRLNDKPAFKDVYSVMAYWGANHCALAYGHIGKELLALASMLRIPVAMHNIEDSEIFRPHMWDGYGADDKTGADYRACKELGPLYK